jgi:hypothetical protein
MAEAIVRGREFQIQASRHGVITPVVVLDSGVARQSLPE